MTLDHLRTGELFSTGLSVDDVETQNTSDA
jgi:hypothetical protein